MTKQGVEEKVSRHWPGRGGRGWKSRKGLDEIDGRDAGVRFYLAFLPSAMLCVRLQPEADPKSAKKAGYSMTIR